MVSISNAVPVNLPLPLQPNVSVKNSTVITTVKMPFTCSFDIEFQYEFTIEENIELARRLVQEQFVNRVMIANLAVHTTDWGKSEILERWEEYFVSDNPCLEPQKV